MIVKSKDKWFVFERRQFMSHLFLINIAVWRWADATLAELDREHNGTLTGRRLCEVN